MNRLSSQSPGGTMRFAGTLNEAATVTIQGAPATVTSDDRFAGGAQVGSGTTQVVVKAKDYAGNERTNTYEVSVSGSSKTFTFDANGNMTGDGTRTFEWDAENRLIAVKDGAVSLVEIVYGGGGQRFQKTGSGVTTTYVYDDDNHILEERPSTGGTIRYWYGFYVDDVVAKQETDSSVYYYTKDHLGSVREVTTSAGNVSVRRDYDPWGNAPGGESIPGFAFTGRVWDTESELYDYRARFYNPAIGRFLSEDPTGLADGPNRFRYALNSPSMYVDPFGTQANEPPGESYPGDLGKEFRDMMEEKCQERAEKLRERGVKVNRDCRPVSFELQPPLKNKRKRSFYGTPMTLEEQAEVEQWKSGFMKRCTLKDGDVNVRIAGYVGGTAFLPGNSIMVCCDCDRCEG